MDVIKFPEIWMIYLNFDYPITPHISTCAYTKDNQNFAIFHSEKATDISTCAYVQPSL